ncbi:MAG: rsgA [Paucimonas sp.]|nr:rsgA [Paucimonas sp.]
MSAAILHGIIIAAHGRHYVAQVGDMRLQCVTRGKKSHVAVGDVVDLKQTSPDQAVIERVAERRTLLFRSDQYKSKFLAANVDQILIMVATEPGFSEDLISRSLVAATAAGIQARILLNKVDLQPGLQKSRERLARYAALGYPVHELTVQADPQGALALLQPLLARQTTILIGQSGMGKSSLVNLLVPDADIAVREISAALDTGKHTTTFTRLYQLADDAAIIDSPGFQEFGLHHLSEGMLERAFPEFAPALGQCRFTNCHHVSEPDCAVLAGLRDGSISAARHALYLQLRHESAQTIGY